MFEIKWQEHGKIGKGQNPMLTSEFVANIGQDDEGNTWWVLAKDLKLTANRRAEWLVLFSRGDDDFPPCFFAHEESRENYWDALIREYHGKYCRYEEIYRMTKEFHDEYLM